MSAPTPVSSSSEAKWDQAGKVFCWINWFSLTGLGGFTVYDNIAHYSELTRLILAIYLCLFGLGGILFEAGHGFTRKKLAFLDSLTGRGIFFLFVGTLGLSFGWQTDPAGRIVPFLVGLISVVAGCMCLLIDLCLGTGKGSRGGYAEVKPTQGARLI